MPRKANSKTTPVTPAQLEVGKWLASGLSARETAVEMGIKVKTVDCHRTTLYAKLGVRNIAQLTRWAIREGVVDV